MLLWQQLGTNMAAVGVLVAELCLSTTIADANTARIQKL